MENKEEPKKCFCARCFLPVHEDDKVDIEGQNFHRICSMCCVCRCIPKSIKMFYGHVFCNECFKTHVLSRFRGEGPKMQTNSWWMQWAPGPKPPGTEEKTDESKSKAAEEPQKRCICSRCLLAVDENDKVDIGNQSFHPQCAKCYFCHKVPKHHVKIYYGQVFCEDCFNKHVMSKGSNPSDFFKTCFEQWQNNTQFADNMRQFMATNKECSPYVFMMQGQPSCRCGGSGNEWDSHSEARKCA